MTGYSNHTWRFYFLLIFLAAIVFGLTLRMIDLSLVQRNFLLKQGQERSIRFKEIPAHRGMIKDRNNKLLAVSVPIASVWIDPGKFDSSSPQLNALANVLDLDAKKITDEYNKKKNKKFLYLKRHISPDLAQQVQALNISGVYLQQEYQRYYPEGETTVNILGFNGLDDQGQEGLELAYDSWLRGVPGKKQVIEDRLGNVVTDLGVVSDPEPGHDLILSIDKRLQYLVFTELKNAVDQYHAEGGAAVVLSTKTGEVLALVNQPSCNPNDRANMTASCARNRAVLDLFEPGSTIKAFTVASALESGKYTPNSFVDTNPGRLVIGKHTIYDDKHINHGVLNVTQVLQKSSDIGVTKMALSLPAKNLLNMLENVGFGQTTQSGFPSEASGRLPKLSQLKSLTLATLAYGYASSVTALQLARAYTVIASSGILRPVTFLKADKPQEGQQVVSKKVAKQILAMLETVLDVGGTGTKAQIHGYKIAGKTGTAHIAATHGYYKDRYFSLFAGIAPATDPELVVVVMIKNPRGLYYGGAVAAPVFANIAEESLRMLNIPPDNL